MRSETVKIKHLPRKAQDREMFYKTPRYHRGTWKEKEPSHAIKVKYGDATELVRREVIGVS